MSQMNELLNPNKMIIIYFILWYCKVQLITIIRKICFLYWKLMFILKKNI